MVPKGLDIVRVVNAVDDVYNTNPSLNLSKEASTKVIDDIEATKVKSDVENVFNIVKDRFGPVDNVNK